MRKVKRQAGDKRLALRAIFNWIPRPFLFHASPQFAPLFSRRVFS